MLICAWPRNWRTAQFSYTRRVFTLVAGQDHDIGTLEVPRRRVPWDAKRPDLGFDLMPSPPGGDPLVERIMVALVRADGPAGPTGLLVGDVIVAVDGYDVRGEHRLRYSALTKVAPGTELKLTLDSDRTIAIIAGEPR